MAYIINKTNGIQLSVVEDGTVETKYAVKLIGKNYAGYGEIQNENFVFLMENFASTSPPTNPLEGQLWYKTSEEKVYVYRSTGWKSLGVAVSDSQAPASSKAGDLFWHTSNKQLSVYDGSQYILVGPQSVANAGITQMRSRSVLDTDSAPHAIIEAVVDGSVVYVISPEEFEVNTQDDLADSFDTIKIGLNLPYSSTGVTNTVPNRFQGTATNAEKLNGLTVQDIVDQAGQGAFGDSGITIGDSNDLAVFIDVDGSSGIIKNTVSNKISLKTTVSGNERTVLILDGSDALPGSNSVTNLGNNIARFNTVYASSFNGVADKAKQLWVDSTSYLDASKTTLYNTIAVRDLLVVDGQNKSNIKSDYFEGIATSAQYADLAEKYLADAAYAPGTVIAVGGEAEVTAAPKGEKVIGVVSTNPAYLMNSELTGANVVAVALKGRVPVKVRGEVKKGDELISSGDGYAEALTGPVISKAHFHVFAVALGSNANGEGTVEAVIL